MDFFLSILFLFNVCLGQGSDYQIDCVKMQCDDNFKKVYSQALTGNADAQNQVGEMLHFGKGVRKDFHLAKTWYLLASNQGHGKAPNQIGRLYSNGEGVQVNLLEACAWYRISRDRGNEWGKINFKKCFATTNLTPKK